MKIETTYNIILDYTTDYQYRILKKYEDRFYIANIPSEQRNVIHFYKEKDVLDYVSDIEGKIKHPSASTLKQGDKE
jgi:hypothetical protein